MLFQMNMGPALAMIQTAVQSHQIAQAASIVYFFTNLMGLGIGLVLVGILNDVYESPFGDKSLSAAISIVALEYFIAAYYWRAGESVNHSKWFGSS
ncbi:hypothetical protein G8770_17400 [Aestuariicella hydrocarbonica]|uniref:Uncharacterized protein n=1 Tax=Pseudomaricurvus hydrocarbonicus TaxID=1470433 RepID=A0A9E5MN76_9GAMM|nr:hypothetical protein [Aestuariicella hydrocarbonica]NHO67325.1 hypothetical protein [Aestuariicella hydrocarbonica]